MKSRLHIISLVASGLFVIMMMLSDTACAQCNLKVESKIEKSDSGQNGDIYLKVKRGSGRIDFYLIDRNEPAKGTLKKESKSASELKSGFVLVFKDVPPATYIIQVVDDKKCQVSVGGIEGITISGN